MEVASKFKISPTKTLNMVLVGRSGCGKTTLKEMFLNPKYTIGLNDLHRPTKDPQLFNYNVFYENKGYNINVIDTPGLYEFSENSRNDQQLMSIFSTFLFQEIISINCVGLVYDGSKGIDDKDIEIFKKLIGYFKEDFSENTILIITHKDLLATEEIENLKNIF